ncbi:MAG: L,D-transpeptidase family protein [Sulfurimonas sp.]|uniref:L,D-transpeptidase family protein n=1 Tax=Sulfurimonas sp. TaxID=2022749 RepID=UPI0026156685|nr:L,D-transpeptidase family protein [Sulfurimonas sp.]MDD2651426.1 L,D-transpeptidase family protein [Sulfurimonas sp.]MDD3450967.1 L,D-transpeptidase family protein [Sulfurimonas sp.]
MVLVIADEYNSTKAELFCFEQNRQVLGHIEVNLGQNGLGFGIGDVALMQKSAPLKQEGDKKAPIGIFTLDFLFGYEANSLLKMPYLHATKELICVDDTESKFYNQIIKKPYDMPKSFEEMRRNDGQYELGITVGHNKEQFYKRGSCIFIHVQIGENAPTAGCTSMRLEDLQKIASWLDISKKPILIQITKAQKEEVLKLYPKLRAPLKIEE